MNERGKGQRFSLHTQYLEEADELAHSIAVVDHGRIIARGTADELKAQIGGERIEVTVRNRDDIGRAVDVLKRHGEVDCNVDDQTEADGTNHRRRPTSHSGRARVDEVTVPIDDIGLRRPTLDDVFLALTGHAAELALDGSDERRSFWPDR